MITLKEKAASQLFEQVLHRLLSEGCSLQREGSAVQANIPGDMGPWLGRLGLLRILSFQSVRELLTSVTND